MTPVYVALDSDLYNEFILRSGKSVDVSVFLENIVRDFLDRTKNDNALWSEEYLLRVEDEPHDTFAEVYGARDRGYHWQNVFLPNGSKLRMTYQRADHFAEVRHQRIVFEDTEYSPSEFARHVANNTSRNAWRDIWVLFPGEKEWRFADALRRQQK